MLLSFLPILFVAFVSRAPLVQGEGATEGVEIIMENGDRLEAGESLTAHAGACKLRLTNTGVLKVKRKFENHPSHEDDYVTAWTSGVGDHEGNFFLNLNVDGNLVVYERHEGQENSVAYRTRTDDSSNVGKEIRLAFEEDCRLTLYKNEAHGTMPNHPSKKNLWTNIKHLLSGYSSSDLGGWVGGEGIGTYYTLLQKGEMFCDVSRYWQQFYGLPLPGIDLPVTLYLTHNCNLEMFVGTDLATRYHHVGNLWDANVAKPDLEDCYLYGNGYGLSLHEGLFSKNGPAYIENRPGQYWVDYGEDDFCNDEEYGLDFCDGDYDAYLDPLAPNGIILHVYG